MSLDRRDFLKTTATAVAASFLPPLSMPVDARIEIVRQCMEEATGLKMSTDAVWLYYDHFCTYLEEGETWYDFVEDSTHKYPLSEGQRSDIGGATWGCRDAMAYNNWGLRQSQLAVPAFVRAPHGRKSYETYRAGLGAILDKRMRGEEFGNQEFQELNSEFDRCYTACGTAENRLVKAIHRVWLKREDQNLPWSNFRTEIHRQHQAQLEVMFGPGSETLESIRKFKASHPGWK
jgi:hypothetical protein